MGFIVPEEAAAFWEDSDGEILAYMAMQDEDAQMSRAAYAEFYRRHVRWLYALLMRNASQHLLGGPEAVAEFVQDTFQRAFAGSRTFNAGGVTDQEGLQRRARAWLGTIGTRLMLDVIRDGAPGAFEELADPDEHPTPEAEEIPSPELEVMREVLDELSEREKDVVLEWAHHYKPGVAHQRLPNDASSTLARRWSTTPAHIRVIRKRTFDRMKEEVPTRLTKLQTEKKP